MGLKISVLLVVVMMLGGVGAAAQERVSSASLHADLSPDGTARVTIDYVFSGASAESLGLELLGFADATVEEIFIGTSFTGIPFDAATGRLRSATVEIPGETDPSALRVRYDVANAARFDGGRFEARIPVLSVKLPPDESTPGLFRAAVTVPEGWTVSEGFPTGLRPGADARFDADLPVVPAMVGVRGRVDGGWRPGLPLLLDLMTVVVLVAFSIRGWMHLRAIER